jgi:hypothetical protein
MEEKNHYILSNEESRQLLDAVMNPSLEQVVLAHLSQECNLPEVALKAMEGIKVPIEVLHQDGPSRMMPFLNPLSSAL